METAISNSKNSPDTAAKGLADLYGPELHDLGRADAVYEVLCAAIRGRRFQAGERIREEEIAEALTVSRTPVREALHRLASRGLIELVGRGFAVARPDRRQTAELFAVREVLEGAAARFAAQNAGAADIARLQELNAAFVQAKDVPDELIAFNRAFHQTVSDAAHNRYLTQLLNGLYDTLGLLPGSTLTLPGRPAAAREDHAALIAAIERRDPDAAEDIARRHIRAAQQLRLTMGA